MVDRLTLLDLAVNEKKDLRRGFMKAMFKGKLPTPIDSLPVTSAQSFSQTVLRLTDPGTPSYRNIGGTAAAYKATFADGVETLKLIHNKLTIDVASMDVKTYIQDPITMQITTYADVVKALVNQRFIDGDPGTDETVPAGLRYRLENDATFVLQSLDANNLDVDSSEANMFTWLDLIDECITLVGGGNVDQIIMNRQTWIRFRSVLRRRSLLNTTKDQFDRVVSQYDGIKFFNAGQKPAGMLTSSAGQQVIGNNTETSLFGDGTTTPMYFIATGGDDGVSLLQLGNMRTKRIGQNPNNPAEFVVDFRWAQGFFVQNKFSIGSIQGLII